jgi:hypothetical protein
LPFLITVPEGTGELGGLARTHDRQRDEGGNDEDDDDRCGHGSNSPRGNMLPTVAERTTFIKMLPLH